MNKRILITCVSIILFLTNVQNVRGLEVEITGNGDGSSNEVSIEVSQETTSSQSNKADIDNNVDVNANTGGNQAGENTGDETSIDTGDGSVDVKILNDANLSSVTTNDCCGGNTQESSITITGNGSSSINTANYSNKNITNATVNNTAVITNNITGSADTGNNKTNSNNKNSTITTGDIRVSDVIKNNKINQDYVSIANSQENVSIKIEHNGKGSINDTTIDLKNNKNININNFALLFNNSIWDLNTGKNEIIGGAGDAIINTGYITFKSKIVNKLNENIVEITCCDEKEKLPTPTPPIITPPPTTPPTPPGPNGNGSNPSGGNGNAYSVGGAVASIVGSVLPKTGSSWWFYATLANIITLLMGLYLRLKAGRSPGYAFNN